MRDRLKSKRVGPNNREQRRMDRTIDALDDFQKFRNDILKAIRVDIKNKMAPKALREKYAAILQGRMITDALTTDDVMKATVIAKDVIDRVEGKATEKKEVTHRFKDMTDQELDAVLQSEEKELQSMNERFDQ